ncbi:TolC family protein, partial [Acinetobacter terrae]|uniref:TolC family protein n=1 Tax=Acinetobacter terrae TaxID=2731247 RepID=UPI001488929C
RPDLQALQAGYASQDIKLRQAILAQFPALNVGLTHASDSSGLKTQSLGISLSLPIFNRNRGNIGIEKATRQRMQAEYQIRLNQTYASVIRLQSEQKQQLLTWQNRYTALKQLQHDVDQSRSAAHQGLIDDLIWINLNNTLFNQQLDLLTLEQSIREQHVGLNILLGLPTLLRSNE